MRILILSIFIFTLVACEQTETPTTESPKQEQGSAIVDTIAINHLDADTSKILLMGRGSEPGWICQFFQTKVRFIFNNGTDSLILRGFDFSNQMRMPDGFEKFKLASPGKDTIFETLPGPCKEESTGEERALQMQIKLNKITYKGCAWVPK